jgi:aryl-alcohol dehydrogenase-like predicted oxidoreductase
MEYRTLGRSGPKVSVVGFGGWPIGGGYNIAGEPIGYGETDDFESIAAIEKAIDVGINLIDTADAYGAGHSECLIGQVLQARHSDCFVATKVGHQRRDPFPSQKNFEHDYIVMACESSLRRLRRKVIDVYQLHNPSMEVIKSNSVWETLNELRESHKIRFIGSSVFRPEEGIELINNDRVDVLQLEYNIFHRDHEDELLPLAKERNIGIIARTPLAWGLLTGKFTETIVFEDIDHRSKALPPEKLKKGIDYINKLEPICEKLNLSMAELALKFVLSNPAVSCVIPGAKRLSQVEQNAAAGENSVLPEALIEEIKQTTPGDFLS